MDLILRGTRRVETFNNENPVESRAYVVFSVIVCIGALMLGDEIPEQKFREAASEVIAGAKKENALHRWRIRGPQLVWRKAVGLSMTWA